MAASLRERINDHAAFSSRIAELNRRADACIAALLEQPRLTLSFTNGTLRAYVAYKFSVTEQDYQQTENFIQLARISIQRALAQHEIFYDQRDCHGVSESMEKKMLLITDVEKKINHTFPVEDYIKIDTVGDLAEQVYRYLTSVREERRGPHV